MPEDKQFLRVLVASPDDVADERLIVRKVLKQVNSIGAHHAGLHLEFLGWETLHPGFGVEPQAVINQQIGEDYDIFVGILWTRFGTPTEGTLSGTQEEFERAYQRHKENPGSIPIMFYFSEVEVIWSNQDLTQLQRVKDFRGSLPLMGGFYSVYRSKSEFEELLAMHLGQLVHEWGSKWGIGKKKPLRSLASDATEEEELNLGLERDVIRLELDDGRTSSVDDGTVLVAEDEGFLDLVESGTEEMERVREITVRMTQALEDLGQNMKKRTEMLTAAAQDQSPEKLKRVKIVVNATASDMFEFVRRMDVEVPLFSRSSAAGIRAYGKAAVLLRDFGPSSKEQIEEALSILTNLNTVIADSKGKLRDLRGTVSKIPRISTAFNQARTKVIRVLDDLDREFEHAMGLASESQDLMRGALAD